MNVIKLCGGLGNQLFQYAFGKAQTMLYETDVYYAMLWYNKKRSVDRPYILNRFRVNIRTRPFIPGRIIKDPHRYDFDLLKIDGCNFSGYWQQKEYYINMLPILREEFCVKEELYTKEFLRLRDNIINSNSVAIHVRRGDLLVNGRDYAQTLDYYNEALRIMRSFKNDCKVFVFSDDLPWCKENFKDVTFVSLAEHLDFELMKHCKHFIIANSTFSWWASFLNDNPDKIIIAPNKWRSKQDEQRVFEEGLYFFNDWIVC